MATKYLAKTMAYGLLLQANWATPQAASAAFKQIPYNAGVSIPDPDISVGAYNTSGQYGLHKEVERFKVDARSGLPKLNFAMTADLASITPHLAGALFGVTEVAAGSYQKAFAALGLTGTLDFNGNGTKVYTIAVDNSASADDGIILENAIIDNLTLSFDFLANGIGRFAQLSGTWVGNEMNFEQTTSGVWVTTADGARTGMTVEPLNDVDVFSFSTLTSDTVDWSGQNVRSFNFNVANNVTSNAATTAGKANNYDISPVYTSTIILDYNATTELVLKDFQDGATITATLDNTTHAAGARGDFIIALSGGKLTKPPFQYNGDFTGVGLEVMWHSTAGATPVTIQVTDGIQWGYSAP